MVIIIILFKIINKITNKTRLTIFILPLTHSALQVDAHRRQSLARLPMVLVLHLKRFLFDKTGGSQKLLKQVSYKIDLDVGRGKGGEKVMWCQF